MITCNQWMIRRGSIPLDIVNRHAVDFKKSENWLSYKDALDMASEDNSADGVGFALTREDPYFFIDLDDCYIDGAWTPLAQQIVAAFAGAWVELSNSHTGLHIYGRASSIPEHCCKNNDLNIELYSHSKPVHVTHMKQRGSSEHDCTAALHWLIESFFQPKHQVDTEEWTTEPRDDWNGHTSDDELIGAAFAAVGGAAAFGNSASFGDLFEAREEVLAVNYPDATRPYGASEADAALAQHLAFWTGCNCERIDTIMRRSQLYRDKWDDRGDYYLPRTIMRACARQEDVHSTAAPTPAAPVTAPAPTTPVQLRDGYQYMAPSLLLDYFKGCTYVTDVHKVLVPGGKMLDAQRFKAVYGGYSFALDTTNDKSTTNAYEAFTESRAISFPKVDSSSFRPDLSPGEVFRREGESFVNTYWPCETESVQGDVTPFLNHMHKILPNKNDAEIMIAYMAAIVQHKGVKFQWCPLVQGAEGNGKSLLSRVVREAIGKRYSHFPRAQQMDSEFNKWIFNNIFIGVEDIYIPERKAHMWETLKPLITGEFQEVRQMQTDGYCAEICCNFILNSNHKDAVRKTASDRRLAVFYCPQQSAEDILRDGMDADYFADLYQWLREGGYAMCTYYLSTYAIPNELNPAVGCQRAPETSTTDEAITASLGSIEQAIMEAVEEERQGFAGGWISSVYLDKLLSDMRAVRAVPINKRRDLLQTIGYDWHPNLKNGRTNTPSEMDGGNKPKLFVRKGSIQAGLTDPKEILAQYIGAQQKNPFAMNPISVGVR